MGVKVAKFGGSSVADKFQIEKLKEIITADKDRRYIIVSAPGKRFDTDTKMTDILYLCHTHREHNFPYNQLLQVVEDRFTATAANLDTKVNIAKEFDIIRENLEKGCTPDYIASRGEYLSAMLTADFLGFDFVDTQELILFSDNGKMLEEETNKAIKECLDKHEYAVLPGFYGSYKSSGNVKTFSRGGSDITGAVVARAIGAEVYENWTDVSGFLMADPHIVDNPRRIDKISYKELRELSYLGATVMHPDVVEPVVKLGIPIIIKNTMDPEAAGTLVVKDKKYYKESMEIAGISGKRGFVVIKLEKTGLNDDTKLRQSILDFFAENSVKITNIIAGIDSLILLVPKDSFEKTSLSFFEMEANIRKMAGGIRIDITKDIAVIGVVGRELGSSPTVVIKTLSALAGRRIDVKLIDHGQGQISILIAIAANDYAEAIRSIYGRFV